MAGIREPIRLLDADEMARIHHGALEILDRIGMRVQHHKALDYLRDYGCRVDHDSSAVKFPPEVVARSVDLMRRAYADPDRVPERMAVRYSHIRFRAAPHHVYQDFSVSSGGFCCFIYDLAGNRRRATMQDVRDSLKLAEKLPNIDFTGLPVSDQETPENMRPIVMAAELVKNTRKLGGIETFDVLDVEYITRIAEVVAGGAEQLRKKPVLVGYGEARSPLCLDENMVAIFLEYIKRGLPQTIETMPCAGTTAPATLAGTLALGCAETLCPLVLAHSVDEDAVIGVDILPSHADMRSGLFSYGAFGRVPYIVGRVQMISEYYGCPSGIHGLKTNSCTPGFEAGAEKVLSMVTPILAGACGIGTMGAIENALTYSPVQMVLDDALTGNMRYLTQDFDIGADALALDIVEEIGIGGEYMTHLHTAEHYRDNMYHDWLFDCKPWASAENTQSAEAKAADRARELLAEDNETILTGDQEEAIDEIVAEATTVRNQRS